MPFINKDELLREIQALHKKELEQVADQIAEEAAAKYKQELRGKLLKMASMILEECYEVERARGMLTIRVLVKEGDS